MGRRADVSSSLRMNPRAPGRRDRTERGAEGGTDMRSALMAHPGAFLVRYAFGTARNQAVRIQSRGLGPVQL